MAITNCKFKPLNSIKGILYLFFKNGANMKTFKLSSKQTKTLKELKEIGEVTIPVIKKDQGIYNLAPEVKIAITSGTWTGFAITECFVQ